MLLRTEHGTTEPAVQLEGPMLFVRGQVFVLFPSFQRHQILEHLVTGV
ncbi:hypothetical protein NC651_028559 [Populus alba x Populus x berolinensis]|nr:hypothetical protein NC651_028559 [Populus alba x Populus x berolinensis]